MYDIFYVSKNKIEAESWLKIKDIYPTAQKIENVKSFNDLSSRSFTKLFWIIWDDLQLTNNINLTDYRATEWDNMYVHVFKNGEHYDGICLFPKNKQVSQREFDYRFFVDKKEIDVVASFPKFYDKFVIDTYEDYLSAIKTSTTTMFWAVWSDVKINNNFKFNYQVPRYNQHIVHIFKNGEHYDGICIFPTSNIVSKKEFINRFFTNKKEIDIVASSPTSLQYDIIFLSYNEPNADKNYNALLKKCPTAKRVNGVKGIHQAHIAAAMLATTELFYVVDGDADLVDSFDFNTHIPIVFREHVHVWRSRNPVNDLEYGYGGVKLLPRDKTINMDLSRPDMTTSISSKFKPMPAVSNITAFNTDEFNTWKSAFRECCKLSSKVIDRQKDDETNARLITWCTVGADRPFGAYAIAGACAGKQYGEANSKNIEALKKINDFVWLEEKFNEIQ